MEHEGQTHLSSINYVPYVLQQGMWSTLGHNGGIFPSANQNEPHAPASTLFERCTDNR